MAIQNPVGIVQWIRGYLNPKLGRGSQVEFQSPRTLFAPNNQDGDGTAIGDSTASAVGDATFYGLTLHSATEVGYKEWLGRGPWIEFQSPAPLRAPAVQETDGTAVGDAIADGALDAFGDFAGAATGDAVADGSLTALGDFVGAATGDATASGEASDLADFAGSAIGDATASGEASDLADFAGAATGDSTASGTLDAFGDFASSAIGDAIASGDLDAFGDFAGAATGDAIASGDIIALPFIQSIPEWCRPGVAVKLGRGAQIEFQTPLTLKQPAAVTDGDGAAVGDSTADGALDAFGDFAGAVTGDSIADGALTALADFAGSAIGDSTADATATAIADFDGAATGDSTVDGVLTALADFAGSATGDAIVSGALDALADFDGSAVGDAIASAEAQSGDTDGLAVGDSTASGALDALADMDGLVIGDAIASAQIEDATPAVITPTVTPSLGVGGPAWRNWYRSTLPRKKKKKLDELDEMIAALEARIEIVPPEVSGFDEDVYERTLRVSQALAARRDFDRISDARIGQQIAQLKRAVEEIDDEEAIILALS